jgi:hypothetical protein
VNGLVEVFSFFQSGIDQTLALQESAAALPCSCLTLLRKNHASKQLEINPHLTGFSKFTSLTFFHNETAWPLFDKGCIGPHAEPASSSNLL